MSRRKKKNRSPGSCSLSETSALPPAFAQYEEREPKPNPDQLSSWSSDNESEEQYNFLSSSMDNITTVLQDRTEETKSQAELNPEKLFKLIILGQETQNKELNEENKTLQRTVSSLNKKSKAQGRKISELNEDLQKTESINNRLKINLNFVENNVKLLEVELAKAKGESEESSRHIIFLKEKIGREVQLHQTLKERLGKSICQRQMMVNEKFENSIVISQFNCNTGKFEDSSLCPERKKLYDKLAVANFKLEHAESNLERAESKLEHAESNLERAESKILKVTSALFLCFLCKLYYFYKNWG